MIRSKKLVRGGPCATGHGWAEMWQVERQLAGTQSFEPHAWFFSPGNQTTSCPKQYSSAYHSCRDLGTVEFDLLICSVSLCSLLAGSAQDRT